MLKYEVLVSQYWYIDVGYHNTPRYQYNCPIIHLWNAENQSSWPTQGFFPRLDCQPPPPTTSRWEDFDYSQISATTSRWLLADSHLVGSGWLSQWYPEFQVVAGTCLQYTSTLLQLRLPLTGCHANLVHLWRFGKILQVSNYAQTAFVAQAIICAATYKVGLSIMATACVCIVRGWD